MTRFSRREVVAMLGAGVVAPALAQEAYPRRPINMICAFPPGSGADVLVRFWANKLGPIAGTTVVVQNKPGAMANVAAEFTSRSKPDGYTILVHAGSSIAGNMHIFKKPPINVEKDLIVASTLSRHSYMVVVGPDSPFRKLEDLTAAMRAKGEKGSYGTANTPSFVIGKLYAEKAGLKAVQVNYRSSIDFVNDLKSGVIDFAITDSISALSLDRQGQWRMLAVGSGQRMASTPNLPTLSESGVPGVDLVTWWGAMVAAGTPDAIVEKIHRMFAEAMNGAEVADFLRQQGNDLFPSRLPDARQMLGKSAGEWKELVEKAGVERIRRLPRP